MGEMILRGSTGDQIVQGDRVVTGAIALEWQVVRDGQIEGMFGSSGNKAQCWIEFGGPKKEKYEDEVWGLNNWVRDMGNAEMGLELGLGGAAETDLADHGNAVTTPAILG